MEIESIKAVIFDLGGTLYVPASQLLDISKRYLKEIGLPEFTHLPDEEITRALEGPDKWLNEYMVSNNVHSRWEPPRDKWVEYDRRFLLDLGVKENVDELASKFQSKWDEFLSYSNTSRNYTLIDGCKEGLERLREGDFKLGVASNRFGDPTPSLKQDEIFDLFEAIEYTGVPGYKKPSPFMLLKVAREIGVNPMKCIYVGNIVQYDVVSAHRADMTPVLLTWCDPEEIGKAPPETLMFDHIHGLVSLLT
ncbi:MAG: HAD family hydrolase [Candidatus Thorarchaeota archaeon]|jgi:HAD superfamily hydrolase (TIGR01549 family)